MCIYIYIHTLTYAALTLLGSLPEFDDLGASGVIYCNYMCVCVYIYIYEYMYIVCLYICIYIYIYMYTHTYAYTYRAPSVAPPAARKDGSKRRSGICISLEGLSSGWVRGASNEHLVHACVYLSLSIYIYI